VCVCVCVCVQAGAGLVPVRGDGVVLTRRDTGGAGRTSLSTAGKSRSAERRQRQQCDDEGYLTRDSTASYLTSTASSLVIDAYCTTHSTTDASPSLDVSRHSPVFF